MIRLLARPWVWVGLSGIAATALLRPAIIQSQENEAQAITSTGKLIRPVGTHVEVGSYPVNMILSPDGKFAIVTCVGFREFLSVIRVSDGSIADKVDFNAQPTGKPLQGLYYGIAFSPASPSTLYVSRGAEDLISVFELSSDGKLTDTGRTLSNPAPKNSVQPNFPAGLAFDGNGSKLYVVNNETTHTTDYKGSLSVLDSQSGEEQAKIPTSGFPMDVCAITDGPDAGKKLYVSSERDSCIDLIDPRSNKKLKSIKTGAAPVGMVLSKKQDRLYVANSGSDTVSIINTRTGTILNTVLLRPNELRGLPGAGPTGLALSPDQRTLYVALNDMNAVAFVDTRKGQLSGYLPTGWLPTSVVPSPDGKALLIASAKGVQAKNPNNKPVGENGQYIENIIEGTVTRVKIPNLKELKTYSTQVIKNNRLRSGLDSASHKDFVRPPVEHVIYIIKENRTYDNVLGDLKQGNGDASICLFPREVTPNQHALAERFVLLDNFYVCAEVSQDGWVWSTAGMISAYASRNTPYNYSDRGRNYDTEGSNNGVPVDILGLPDVTRPPSGYIWEHCIKNGVTFRNYGFFSQSNDPADKRQDVLKATTDNTPTKRALQGLTNVNYRRYDLAYADSQIYDKYDWSWPRRRKTFGQYNSPSRFSEWKREFDQYVKSGKMPRFQTIRFGQDHTSGTGNGQPTPRSMVADNDYAVGQLVEAVSHSPFWKNTVVCVLEDDAQAGYDHVDAHRSTAYIISPYITKSTIDSRFYNTDSMLRTMELLLGMPPMSQYDAVASPIAIFGKSMVNAEPYTAIMPSRDIVCKANSTGDYRAHDSSKISFYAEESLVDEDLNDILWGSIKGRNAPRPQVKRSGLIKLLGIKEDDDD